jgi:hypothetical protein
MTSHSVVRLDQKLTRPAELGKGVRLEKAELILERGKRLEIAGGLVGDR